MITSKRQDKDIAVKRSSFAEPADLPVSDDEDEEITQGQKKFKKQGVRQRLLGGNLKNRLKELQLKAQEIGRKTQEQDKKLQTSVKHKQADRRVSHIGNSVSSIDSLKNVEQGSDNSEDDIVHEVQQSPFINYDKNRKDVILTSPVFGDSITIKKPSLKFGSSKNALKDLKHVENQIKELSVMPDFGYAEDNYLLNPYEGANKWKLLTGLLGDSKRFAWLMNFILLQKLEAEVQNHEDQEKMAK